MTNTCKILLIEDDQDQINMYRFKFEKEGFVLISARNGGEGITAARSEKPDIILLDLILVNESGVEVLKKLKSDDVTRDIPVIMLTNLAKKEMKLQSERLGAVDFIVKTQITPSDLVRRVNQELG
ncbi:MAG: response regulator [Patescibacteria group bacterium]|nr:response regulator [Patescibacteria group bacterium]